MVAKQSSKKQRNLVQFAGKNTWLRGEFFLAFFLVLLFLGSLPLFPNEEKDITLSSGDVIQLKYRLLQPGEPLLLIWKEKKSDFLEIKFLGKKHNINNSPSQPDFLLLGLDLALKPGLKTLEFSAYKEKNLISQAEFQLEIIARDFPKKELTVDQKYVTPPKEVQERIKREAELLAEIYQFSSSEWLASGPFVLPCEGKLFPNFGQQRIYNRVPRSVHSGVDIAVPTGHPIRATNSGRVVLASDLYFSGKTVIIDHGLGLFSTYCHLSRILVRRGETVKTGQVVGKAGSTGLSTGPHLHWAVKIYEARVDPLSLLELEF
ncbi:MAG: M23 family metallopeptidase [Candidatus Aminicenantes bacterium]|nr:M23 family metallopeptidase [Candidatus Aminicenantes bacterium]